VLYAAIGALAACFIVSAVCFVYKQNSSMISCLDDYYANNTPDECGRPAVRDAFEFSFKALGWCAGAAFLLGLLTFGFLQPRFRQELKDRLQAEEAEAKLAAADDAVYGEGSSLELSPLWVANHERLSLYHRIATQQAQRSFQRAQTAMIVGFSIVAISVPLALIARTAAGSLAAGILGAVAAALSGYISHTFIRSQESAAQHLKAYFLQPLEFSRYLVAERLLNTLNDQQKADGILAIVRGISAFAATGGNINDAGQGEGRGTDAQ
jgi:hypothetical protein